jgi:hypothetical protein
MIRTERHIAVVADTSDPENRFRIKVKCGALLGSEKVVYNQWVEPKLTWGFVLVPDVGEQVEIEVDAGSSTDEVRGQSFLSTPNVRWCGDRFFSPTVTPNEMFQTNYGKRRGFCTPGGHVLCFDDTEGARKINLAWHDGAGHYAIFSIDEDGSVVVANKNGSLIYLNAASGELAVIDEFGNLLATNTDGIKLVDKKGGFIELSAKGGYIQIQAPTVNVGGDGSPLALLEPAVLANQFLTIFRAHTHPTGTGPSGPPLEVPPLAFDVVKAKVLMVR